MIDCSVLSAVEELISREKAKELNKSMNKNTKGNYMLYFRCGGKECWEDATKRWRISDGSLIMKPSLPIVKGNSPERM